MLCLPFFHGQNISFCYTTGRKLMFFFFLGGGGGGKVLSLSTFFTDKKFVYFFHSKNVSFCNSICRHWVFLNVYFFMFVYFFHVLVPCLPIFTKRVLRSLTPYGKNFTLRHVYVFQRLVPCLSFSRSEYFVLLHQSQGSLKVLHAYFFTPVYLFL